MALTKITTSVVAVNSLTAANIADNSIDATKIANNQILARHIASGSLTDQLGTISSLTVGDGHTIGDDSDDNLTIASSAGENIIIDSPDDIILDADGTDIILKDGGTEFGRLSTDSTPNHFYLKSAISDGDIIFQGNDGGSTITAMTIDMSAGGYVGIGTTSPSRQLEIFQAGAAGAYRFKIKGDTSYTGMEIENTASSNTNILFRNPSYTQELYMDTSGNFHIYRGGERLTVTQAGNVGIGDTSPIAKLTVKAASDTIRAESSATDAKNITMSYHDVNDRGEIISTQDGVADKDILIRGLNLMFQRSGGNEAMKINSYGNVGIGTGTGSFTTKGGLVVANGPIVQANAYEDNVYQGQGSNDAVKDTIDSSWSATFSSSILNTWSTAELIIPEADNTDSYGSMAVRGMMSGYDGMGCHFTANSYHNGGLYTKRTHIIDSDGGTWTITLSNNGQQGFKVKASCDTNLTHPVVHFTVINGGNTSSGRGYNLNNATIDWS